MLAPVVALLLSGQPTTPPSSDPAPVTAGADAARLASSTFASACLRRLQPAPSPADYARGSDELGAAFGRDHPAEAALVHLDGAGGRGCRVVYSGPRPGPVWSRASTMLLFLAATGTRAEGGCRSQEATDLRVHATCTDARGASPLTADIDLVRSAAAEPYTVTATITLPQT